MKSVSYRAPAKVILSGEHSVVYTKPAFVSAVSRYLTVTLTQLSPGLSNNHIQSVIYCDKTVREHLAKEQILFTKTPFHYEITSDIPEGRGMGSSAAFCVAFCAALMHWYTDEQPSVETVSNLAFRCETFFHGMPSGVDVSASSYGGLIFYRKEFEFLKTISALNFKLPRAIQDNLLLIDSGMPTETTKEMVALVGRRYNQFPQKMDRVLSAIEKVTKRMVVSVVKEDADFFKECLVENQKLLVQMGIVSPSTRRLLRSLARFGVGKVTGAGGAATDSGLVLFYATDKQSLINHLDRHNIVHFPFQQAFKGVERIES